MINIIDKTKCTGCTACQQICPKKCISMQEDVEGFLYPKADVNICIECGLCEKVCPVLTPFNRLVAEPISYACKSWDNDLVAESSSGGMFTILATRIINEGGVVFGARFAEDWSIIHDYTETIDGLSAFRGSKYVQSYLGNSFSKVRSFLKENRKVLFVGTPCQVAGLNHFLCKKYNNLYTFDIVCHSIASPKVWKHYLEEVSGGTSISNVTFRDKSQGWHSYGLHIQGIALDGETKTLDKGKQTENLFMRGFLEDLTVRPSCSHCPARNYVSGSDIMLADCWHLEKYHPEWDDNKGMSQIMLLTEKGKNILNTVKDNIFIKQIPYNEVEDSGVHAPITRSTPPHPFRKYFFSNLKDGKVRDLISYCLHKYDIKKKRVRQIKKYIYIISGVAILKKIYSFKKLRY